MIAKLLLPMVVVGLLVGPTVVEAAYLTKVKVTIERSDKDKDHEGDVTLQIRHGRRIVGKAEVTWKKGETKLDKPVQLDRTIAESATGNVRLYIIQGKDGIAINDKWKVRIVGTSNDGVESDLVDLGIGQKVKDREPVAWEWKFEEIADKEVANDDGKGKTKD